MLVLARRERVFVAVACSTYSPRGIECVCACVIKINSKYTNIPNENKIGITHQHPRQRPLKTHNQQMPLLLPLSFHASSAAFFATEYWKVAVALKRQPRNKLIHAPRHQISTSFNCPLGISRVDCGTKLSKTQA